MVLIRYISSVCCILTLTFNLVKCDKAALIIIDIQDCFISGGSLAVNNGNDIISIINGIRKTYKEEISLVVLSQDWHPRGHVSFASSHPGVQSPMTLKYTPEGNLCVASDITQQTFPGAVSCQNVSDLSTLTQVLWPDHCIQDVKTGPTSSAFPKELEVHPEDLIIKKGTKKEIDSYSAFFDNGGFGKTELDAELKQRGITHVFVTGLAADYCVYFTSLDAQELGYETYYVMDATKPVLAETMVSAMTKLAKKGVNLITTDRLPMVLDEMKQTSSAQRCINTWPSTLILIIVTLWFKS